MDKKKVLMVTGGLAILGGVAAYIAKKKIDEINSDISIIDEIEYNDMIDSILEDIKYVENMYDLYKDESPETLTDYGMKVLYRLNIHPVEILGRIRTWTINKELTNTETGDTIYYYNVVVNHAENNATYVINMVSKHDIGEVLKKFPKDNTVSIIGLCPRTIRDYSSISLPEKFFVPIQFTSLSPDGKKAPFVANNKYMVTKDDRYVTLSSGIEDKYIELSSRIDDKWGFRAGKGMLTVLNMLIWQNMLNNTVIIDKKCNPNILSTDDTNHVNLARHHMTTDNYIEISVDLSIYESLDRFILCFENEENKTKACTLINEKNARISGAIDHVDEYGRIILYNVSVTPDE